ncbi:ribosome recycling factor [Candidatus Wolfebacteria bacterium]|nr:ribosome recycling factor [Candidatus Wolfebacteria bacterium]
MKLRAVRDEFLKKIKQQEDKGEITEDDKFMLRDKIQKIIDGANEEIEMVLEEKVKEIEE